MQQLANLKSFNIDEIKKILNSLANEDALRIFISAKDGIKKSTQTIKELDLTQRRYYLRLNELIESSLIERRDDAYQLTTLGTVCYGLVEVFNRTLVHRDRLDLADRLKKSKSISPEETRQILETISGKGFIDLVQPVRIIETHEDLISELTSRIHEAGKNILLASYYTDSRLIEALLEACERKINLSFLSFYRKTLAEKTDIVRMILNPNIAKFYTMFLDKRIRTRLSEFPFSFCVIDEKFVIIELPNPRTNDFYLGFSVENESLSQKLMKTFEDLYERGKENPLLEQLKKIS